MAKLGRLFKRKRCAQSMYNHMSEAELSQIARSCNRDEVASIHIRLKQFRSELAACPEWDGDTQDQIWDAIDTHKRLLNQIGLHKNY